MVQLGFYHLDKKECTRTKQTLTKVIKTNQSLIFYKTIYLLIILLFNSYCFAQNCFTDEQSLSQTYLTIRKKSLIVYEKFQNKPMKLKPEKNYSYSNTFKILSNDKELIQSKPLICMQLSSNN